MVLVTPRRGSVVFVGCGGGGGGGCDDGKEEDTLDASSITTRASHRLICFVFLSLAVRRLLMEAMVVWRIDRWKPTLQLVRYYYYYLRKEE